MKAERVALNTSCAGSVGGVSETKTWWYKTKDGILLNLHDPEKRSTSIDEIWELRLLDDSDGVQSLNLISSVDLAEL